MNLIKHSYTESVQTKIAAGESLPEAIFKGGELLTQALLSGHKILTCGNGSYGALAQLGANLFINRYERERPSLPALALGTDWVSGSALLNDELISDFYAKQIRAMGVANDVLLVLNGPVKSPNIMRAIESALSKDMIILALTGGDGGDLSGLLGPNDVEIRAPSGREPRILEIHLLTLHCLCEQVERHLFG